LSLAVVPIAATPARVDAGQDLYSDPLHWVCRPDTEDVCDSGLDVTTVAADGALTVEPFAPVSDSPVDCFYVYPTISRDEGVNSDLIADDSQEGYAARNQVAPLGKFCRVFAPTYRQVTLTALVDVLGGGDYDPAAQEVAYDDVLAAWRHYLAHDNGGRGVVLVGHSQGAGLLNRLIASEIENDANQRDLLVAAYLAGSSVQVPPGEVVGGDFQHVPQCESDAQFGCVMTWAAFRSDSPPPADAFFGEPGDGTQSACTNPAALGGGDAELGARFPADRAGSIIADRSAEPVADPWVDPAVATVTTPFVEVPGLLTGRCVSWDDYNWLEVTVHGDPADPRADDIGGDLTPQWGLHLIDFNLVMADLQRLVATQTRAWAAR
jgi:hypothetical protein